MSLTYHPSCHHGGTWVLTHVLGVHLWLLWELTLSPQSRREPRIPREGSERAWRVHSHLTFHARWREEFIRTLRDVTGDI